MPFRTKPPRITVNSLNTVGKICVVFVTTASLAFAAFALAMHTGGVNWMSEAEELGPDFQLTITPGEPTKYAINHRPTNTNVKTSEVLAQVVIAAREKQIAEARKRLDELSKVAADYKPGIEAAHQAIGQDEAGLEVREKALVAQLEEVTAEIARVNNQIIETAAAAQKVRAEGQERREEVYRLKNQLELLRNDLFAAKVQRKNLEEEELRLTELLQRLERRNKQLSRRTQSPGYESAAKTP